MSTELAVYKLSNIFNVCWLYVETMDQYVILERYFVDWNGFQCLQGWSSSKQVKGTFFSIMGTWIMKVDLHSRLPWWKIVYFLMKIQGISRQRHQTKEEIYGHISIIGAFVWSTALRLINRDGDENEDRSATLMTMAETYMKLRTYRRFLAWLCKLHLSWSCSRKQCITVQLWKLTFISRVEERQRNLLKK